MRNQHVLETETGFEIHITGPANWGNEETKIGKKDFGVSDQ